MKDYTLDFLKVGAGKTINLRGLQFAVSGLHPGFEFRVGDAGNGTLRLLALNNGVAIPEPAPLPLLAAAALAMLATRRQAHAPARPVPCLPGPPCP